MSLNAPKWFLTQLQGTARLAAFGDTITHDNLGLQFVHKDGGYDPWSARRFAQCARAKGIALPSGFDIRQHIRSARDRGLSGDRLIEDGIIHEYVLRTVLNPNWTCRFNLQK